MSLYTQFIFQISLMMIWLLVFGLDMYDDLLGLQVVQCCKRSILIGCIYCLDTGCLFPLIFVIDTYSDWWLGFELSSKSSWRSLHIVLDLV